MTDESQLFAPASRSNGMADVAMGIRGPNGRYKMPLLPGESGTKTAGDWVPGGLQSMTNLAGSISDTRALGIWELEQVLIGLGLDLLSTPADLAHDLAVAIDDAVNLKADFSQMRLYPELKAFLGQVVERAKDASGANRARDRGIEMHDQWEGHGKTGLFHEDPAEAGWQRKVSALLAEAGFEIVPDLAERTVRNNTVRTAGRFDNILRHRSGTLYMADLKTKAKPFWSFLEIDAQLAGYAYAEWMLNSQLTDYIKGPLHYVDLDVGVVLHMPSRPDPETGLQEPRLRKADLLKGWETMRLARQVCDARSGGRSAARMADSWWPSS